MTRLVHSVLFLAVVLSSGSMCGCRVNNAADTQSSSEKRSFWVDGPVDSSAADFESTVHDHPGRWGTYALAANHSIRVYQSETHSRNTRLAFFNQQSSSLVLLQGDEAIFINSNGVAKVKQERMIDGERGIAFVAPSWTSGRYWKLSGRPVQRIEVLDASSGRVVKEIALDRAEHARSYAVPWDFARINGESWLVMCSPGEDRSFVWLFSPDLETIKKHQVRNGKYGDLVDIIDINNDGNDEIIWYSNDVLTNKAAMRLFAIDVASGEEVAAATFPGLKSIRFGSPTQLAYVSALKRLEDRVYLVMDSQGRDRYVNISYAGHMAIRDASHERAFVECCVDGVKYSMHTSLRGYLLDERRRPVTEKRYFEMHFSDREGVTVSTLRFPASGITTVYMRYIRDPDGRKVYIITSDRYWIIEMGT